jgi:hypothetical protein
VAVDTEVSVPAVYPFFATTLAPFAAAAGSMLKARAMATDLASAAPFLMTMSYSRLSARMVTSHLYSMPSVPVSVFLKIMRSKETFLARSSLVVMCMFHISVIDVSYQVLTRLSFLPGTKCPPRGDLASGNMWTVAALPITWLPFWSTQEMHVAVLVSTMALAPFSCSRTYFSKWAPASLKVPSNWGFIWENKALPALNEGLMEKAETPVSDGFHIAWIVMISDFHRKARRWLRSSLQQLLELTGDNEGKNNKGVHFR